ncbi:RluA family pseudouridine synthase [Catenisphaera adipataccumulans]|uniref:Pseudouridine synthase n=1 Tax=Catenisphaera adipataccumulans TaxID=700500 RepID=A0A7W8CY96_9FIRM|nr:RluA family pseudouridine synthase [Catenisphaera adipataccumulans]MBB5183601.1 23S rRNA pseudouridine1911/1915/1917 synthase [Catenisphaera adipataccumulans]
MEKYEFRVTAAQAGQRLDKTAADVLPCSRTRIRELIDGQLIKVNGEWEKASYKVKTDDEIFAQVPPDEELEVKPEPMDLDIVYEDSDLIVINKPTGMVVHPAPGHYEHTLVNGLLAHCTDLSGINGTIRPGIVHRIDKDTSGLLVAAKNDHAHQALSAQLADKTCRREYLAIVHHPFSNLYGTIDAPIGRDVKDRQKMAVTAKNSKPAVTHFEVLENFKDYALVRCQLETGRTHQIRVHMAYIDHPVAGDPKYGYRKTIPADGQLLHAYQLTFVHPTTGETMTFHADMPEEMQKVLQQLREGIL